MSDHHFRKFLKIEKECWNSNESIWISLKRFETIQNVIRVVSDFVTTGERPRIIYCQMDAMHLINFVIYSFINVLVSLTTGTLF